MVKKAIPKALKIQVWNKHIGEDIGKAKCKCCCITDITQLKFHCGHIIAEANGGTLDIDNLLPICESCNKSMAVKDLNKFKKMLTNDKPVISKQNTDLKQKLKDILDRLSKFNDMSLNKNKKDEQIIMDTCNLFLTIKKDAPSAIFTHEKCGKQFFVLLDESSGADRNKINFFKEHAQCLYEDDKYLEFMNDRHYL